MSELGDMGRALANELAAWAACQADKATLRARVQELEQWVNDLQGGRYINCVYCGDRYGPADEVPATIAQVLKEHIERCPVHPMSALRARCEDLESSLETARSELASYEARRSDLMARYTKMQFRAEQAEEQGLALRSALQSYLYPDVPGLREENARLREAAE